MWWYDNVIHRNLQVAFIAAFHPISLLSSHFTNTQNPGFSAYTQHWVLYTWDELTLSISQVGKPLHEFEEDLSRSSLIWTWNPLKLNFESTFPEYVWGVWHTCVFQENVSIVCEYLTYWDPTQMLFKWLIINANLCMIPKVENSIGGMNKNSIHQNALQNRDFVGKVGFYILEAIQVM